MKRIIKFIFPVLLAALIVTSIGWYLIEYDPTFTRDMLLRTARMMERNGNLSTAVWLYNLAYDSSGSDEVALELAEQFKQIGNYSKAEHTLRKAIEDGGGAELYMALSETYVEQGKIRDAVLMLENVGGEMKQTLQALRPAAPEASIPSGSYHQYLSVELSAGGNTIYVSTDNDYPSSLTDSYTGPIALTTGETTLFAVSVGENGLVSPLTVYSYIIYDVVEEVTFTDAGFEAALRAQVGYGPNRVIYSNTLWDITELTLPETVNSLADLKWFPNLQKLTINGALLDLPQAIADCKKLEQLSINGSTVYTDMLHAIGSLPALKSLRLHECGISTIAPLANLDTLEKLDLSSNAIRDISALAGLTGLTELNLSSNALISISGLETLTKLAVLDVSFNSIVSTAPLGTMGSIRELDISSNALRNLESMENLVALEKLSAAYNELLDINVLENCTALTYLDVSHNTLLSIDSVATLTGLQELDFSYNEVKQLPVFSEDCALQVIRGAYNQLSSLKQLGSLLNLTYVDLDYNAQISSINALTGCKALKEVHVYGTKVRNVSALTKLGVLVVYSPV